MAIVKTIHTDIADLHHCSGCGLEDHDRASIQRHVEAGCQKEEADHQWAKTHEWKYGQGWVEKN